MRSLIASVALAATLVGGSAALAAPVNPAKSCFWPKDVTGFAAQDAHTVNVRVGIRDVFQLTLANSSPDIDWTQRIGVQATGASTICSGLDATVVVPGGFGMQRYPVSAVRKLTPDEVKALPSRAQP